MRPLLFLCVFAPTLMGCGKKDEGAAATKDMSEGERIYHRYCVSCHGPQGKGDGVASVQFVPRPTNFTTGPWKIGDKPEGIRRAIVQGIGNMPPVKNLSDAELNALVEHVGKLKG